MLSGLYHGSEVTVLISCASGSECDCVMLDFPIETNAAMRTVPISPCLYSINRIFSLTVMSCAKFEFYWLLEAESFLRS